jgi:rhodanese-related sulfurtransferase
MRQTAVHLAAMAALSVLIGDAAAQTGSIYEATLAEANQKTLEASTEQVRRIVADGSAILVDTRSGAEYAAGHIPNAQTLKGPVSAHVAELEHLVGGDKSKALVVYCNGPYCGQSRRLAEQLVAAGFTNVRRYQLGIPIWRALGGPIEIELEGIVRIFKVDRTAVFVDARSAEEFAKGSIPTARNLPIETVDDTIKKMASGQLADAPLPVDDFNVRIVLFGRDATQARTIADLLARRPWHNVSYFSGSFEALAAALKNK